tara:strand:- start:607 stop:1635 length:1029 start_codon:yes stop_codon:yes gene_type:complete
MAAMRIAVVLLNLGAPDKLASVKPFLVNLFSDAAIIGLPWPWRSVVARIIATKRVKEAKQIYQHLGGRSPLLDNTNEQANALYQKLGETARVFVAMRYWHPQSMEVARAVKAWNPDKVILLPLYPQYSTTTTGSSITAWQKASKAVDLETSCHMICCYPSLSGFIKAHVQLIDSVFSTIKKPCRILFSAHGLPKRIVERGDPYKWQVELTASSIAKQFVKRYGPSVRWTVCYQSRVGPLEWITPSTEEELKKAGQLGESVVVAPIAFVSEHSETLVELDITCQKLAIKFGVQEYKRVPTLSLSDVFISSLVELIHSAESVGINSQDHVRICPREYNKCPYIV